MGMAKLTLKQVRKEDLNEILGILYEAIESRVDIPEADLEFMVYGPLEHMLDTLFGCPDYANYN